MKRIQQDLMGTQVDTNDDYNAFHNHADQATKNMLSGLSFQKSLEHATATRRY